MMGRIKKESTLKNDQKRLANAVTCIGFQYSSEVVNNNAANEKLYELTDKLSELNKIRTNCIPQTTEGYAAELYHKYTFEADAARKGRGDLGIKLGPRGGNGSKGTPDLIVHDNGKLVVEAGLKYRNEPTNTAFDQSNVYDHGRQKICPSDQVDRVKELAGSRAKTNSLKSGEYADTAAYATDRLTYDGVESAPLSRQSAQEICENPRKCIEQAFQNDLKCYAKNGAIYGAIYGAAIGGGISLFSNAKNCYKGDKTVSEAAVDVVKNTGGSAVKGAGLGLVTAGTKQVLIKAGAQNLAKGSAPGAIVTSIIEAGVNIGSDIPKYMEGDIDGGEFALRATGHTASATVKGASAWGGAELGASIGTLLLPGIGTAVGGIVGGGLGYIAGSGAVNWVRGWSRTVERLPECAFA